MDYAAIGAIFTFASIQFVVGFNFHRTYLKLYSDFKQVIDKIAESRKKKFQDGLSTLVSNIQRYQKGDNPITPLSYDFSSKAESSYSFVDYLVTQAREPMELYSKAREHVENAYKWFFISGTITLMGIFPLLSSEPILIVIYFIIVLAFCYALLNWIDYNDSMKKLVKLRDSGE